MSNNESFIDEVNEEVRRDQLFAYIRKYGWIAALAIIALVAGAGWTEYSANRNQAAAEARGDAILDALDKNEWSEREAAFADLPQGVVELLLLGVSSQEAGNTDAAIAAYEQLGALEGVRPIYQELGQFKALTLKAGTMDTAERISALEALASPGRPFALLAREQLAIAQIDAGDADAALATLTSIRDDATATQGLRNRVGQLIVALGGETAE